MTGDSNLAHLREAKRGLTLEQAQAVDDMLMGVLSTLVSERARKGAVATAVRIAKTEKTMTQVEKKLIGRGGF